MTDIDIDKLRQSGAQVERRGSPREESEEAKAMRRRVEELERRVMALSRPHPVPDEFEQVFDAEITGHGAGGDKYTWKRLTNIGGAVADYGTPGTDAPNCSSATDPSAAIEINGATFIPTGTRVRMMEIEDTDDCRYQFVCTTAVFTITGPSGSATAVNFSPYSTSEGATIYNVFEPLNGSPGSLGINVASNGTVGSGTCVVAKIGNIKMPCTWSKANAKWYFSAPNSAA